MTLKEKLHEIMKELEYVGKNTRVKFESTDYRALTEDHLLDLVRPLLIKHKLLIYPKTIVEIFRDGKVTTIAAGYIVEDVESDETREFCSAGQGADTQDKGAGKAMTYMNKYALLKLFQLPMKGEDPDIHSSEEMDAEEARARIIVQAVRKRIDMAGVADGPKKAQWLERLDIIFAEGDLKAAEKADIFISSALAQGDNLE